LLGRPDGNENSAAVFRRACHLAPAIWLVHHYSSCLAPGWKCRLTIGNGQLKLCAIQPLLIDLGSK
jgi:hypothetical protein